MRIKAIAVTIIILFGSITTRSQNNFFEYKSIDTIKIFYNSSADITIEKYADFYRVASIDPNILLFHGDFTDYDIKGTKIFSGTFIKGKLSGTCTYFFSNGNIKELGQFKNGIRDSLWTFYYPDKQIEKTIIYNKGVPFIKTFFKRNGKQLIKDGTGKYRGKIYKNNGKTHKYRIVGDLVNGNLNGKWKIKGVTTETFDNGEFIEGYDVVRYTEPRQIFLENILGYYCHEDLSLFQNNFLCKSCIDNVSWALYGVTSTINNEIYDSFLNEYSKTLDSLNIHFISQILEFKINKDGSISELKTIQTNNIIDQHIVSKLLNKFAWAPLQCEGGSDGINFMMIVKQGGKVYLPQPIIVTNNLEANFMIKQMNKYELFKCE